MRRTFDRNQFGLRRDQAQSGLQLRDASKWIASPMHKKRAYAELRKVSGARFVELAWRVQRIRQQQQRVGGLGIFCGKHRTLSAPIGMSRKTERYPRRERTEFLCNAANALPVP